MKFIFAEKQETKLSLKDVEENQFFVCSWGRLCQKTADTSYLIIADEDGMPYSVYCSNTNINTRINRILPKVLKIEF